MRGLVPTAAAFALLAACGDDPNALTNGQRGGQTPYGADLDGEDGTTPGADPTQPGSCAEGKPHVGFAGTDFVADRKEGAIGVDRRRVKPYAALRSDLQRVLGVLPPGINQAGAAFGDVPARWYSEPVAGGVSLSTTYSVGFSGCYDTVASMTPPPTAENAPVECAKLQRKLWQRTPTPDETKACADLVLGLTSETNARRRWAHACASILTSSGFTTY